MSKMDLKMVWPRRGELDRGSSADCFGMDGGCGLCETEVEVETLTCDIYCVLSWYVCICV